MFSKPFSDQVLFQQAKNAVLQVQGTGSCADLAASIFGGVLSYKMEPIKWEKLPLIPDLTAVYCGYKKPTPEVIKLVNVAKQQQPKIYESLFRSIDACVKQAVYAIKQAKWNELGQLFMHHQGLQYALGVSNQLLDTLVYQLCNQTGIFGAKISGSGLGDCVIGLGKLSQTVFTLDLEQSKIGIRQFPISLTEQGLIYEKE